MERHAALDSVLYALWYVPSPNWAMIHSLEQGDTGEGLPPGFTMKGRRRGVVGGTLGRGSAGMDI